MRCRSDSLPRHPPLPEARLEAARPLLARLGPAHPVVVGLGLDDATASERRIPVTVLDRLWEALADQAGPAAPLQLASEVRASSYGLLTYLLGCAPSGQHALRCLCRRYRELLSEGTGYEVSIDRRYVELRVSLHGPPRADAAVLFATASVVGFVAGEVLGAPRPLSTRLSVAPPPPRSAAPLRRFFGGPVTFADEPSRIVYERAALERGLRGSDPGLCEILEDAAQRRRPTPSSTTDAVREALLATGPCAPPTQAEVAARLGLSPRALRRRLAEEGGGFQAVLDDVRRRGAQAELLRPGIRVADLARTLGYADAAAFRRAFRRWTGLSPSAWVRVTRGN